MSKMIDITGMDKAVILAALFNKAIALGFGAQLTTGKSMTVERARELLDDSDDKYFDYLDGRVIKVDLSRDYIDPWLYDRDNGKGSCETAIIESML